MLLRHRNEEDKNKIDETYKALLNIIFGSIISMASFLLLIILFIFVPLVYKVNALSIFFFKTFDDYLIVTGFFISVSIILISLKFISSNIKKLASKFSIPPNSETHQASNLILKQDDGILKFLDEGEKRIYLLLIDSGGSILQKDLVGLDNYSKATISRIIDKLEKKGIIEKIRHGSTNKIILKQISK